MRGKVRHSSESISQAVSRTSEGDDPPVYEYLETDDEIALRISTSRYSDFLLDSFQQETKLIESLKRLDVEQKDGINPEIF